MAKGIPGTTFNEVDLTQIIEGEPTGTPVGVAGTAERGPAFVPVTVGTFGDWNLRFGAAGGRAGALAVSEWLRNSDAATFLRVLGVGDGRQRGEFGNVSEAGWIVGDDRVFTGEVNEFAYEPSSGEQVAGRTYFLGAFHRDAQGSDFLFRSGIDTADSPRPVVRGVVFTPKGVAATLLSTENFGAEALAEAALDPLDTGSYGTGTGLLGGAPVGVLVRNPRTGSRTARLLLNGHIETPTSPSVIEFSFDPASSSYAPRVLNTNPERTEELGHCLYAWWELPRGSVVVGGDGLFVEQDLMTVGAFLTAGAELGGVNFPETQPNYENFEERYTEPVTPWILSEELPDGSRKRLFRFHSFDSGEVGNTRFKVSISNIQRMLGEWATFDVQIRNWADSDSAPEILRRYSGVTLDPDSNNYIARRIGDQRLNYQWDVLERNQGIQAFGFYPSDNPFVWVEVAPDVEAGLAVKDVIPVAHEGLPHINVTSDATPYLFWDDDFYGASGIGVGYDTLIEVSATFPADTTNEVVFDTSASPLSGADGDVVIMSIETPTELRTFVFASGGPVAWSTFAAAADTDTTLDASVTLVSDDLTVSLPSGQVASVTIRVADELSDSTFATVLGGVRQAPVPMLERLPTASGGRAQQVSWGFRFRPTSVDTTVGLKDWSKFFPSFSDGTRPAFWLTEGPETDAYNNNLFTLEHVWVPTDSNDVLERSPRSWAQARYLRDGDDTTFVAPVTGRFVRPSDFEVARNLPWLRFSVPFFGGFDGLNALDRERHRLTDMAIYREKELQPVAEPLKGPTYTAWRKTAEVLASAEQLDLQVYAAPGIRHRSVTDEIARLAESRLDAIYIVDPEILDENGYTSNILDLDLEATLSQWESRRLDNSFVGAFFPDVIMPDRGTARNVVAPATTAMLGVFSRSDSLGFPWFAAAGANRGQLRQAIGVPVKFSVSDQENIYNANINPLIIKDSTGPVVWGNKTTKLGDSVTNRLNVRRLLIEIRRRVRDIGFDFIFEPNLPATLAAFERRVQPVLADIQSKRGLVRFIVRIDTSTTTPLDFQNGVIRGIIGVQPAFSAEFAEIDFILRNNAED